MAADIVTANLRRAFRAKFWLAAVLFAAALGFDSGGSIVWALRNPVDPQSVTSVHYFYFNAVSFGGAYSHYLAAMLAGLPFAGSYAEELAMFPYLLSRTRTVRYCLSKMACAALSGGLALTAGAFLFLAVLSLKLPLVTEAKLFESQWIPFYELLSTGSGISYFVVCLYFAFLSGALWSGAAMLVSVYLPDKLVVTVSPFVLSFVLTQICRLTKLDDHFRLDRMLSVRVWLGSVGATIAAATLAVAGIWLVCCVWFTRRVKRGLR
ncbi:MAG: hypothetical protein LBQ15_09560 [Clostridium sp.]|jgi:hypothetical protein|nr:hypothetical protein [Clostridium sp.]